MNHKKILFERVWLPPSDHLSSTEILLKLNSMTHKKFPESRAQIYPFSKDFFIYQTRLLFYNWLHYFDLHCTFLPSLTIKLPGIVNTCQIYGVFRSKKRLNTYLVRTFLHKIFLIKFSMVMNRIDNCC